MTESITFNLEEIHRKNIITVNLKNIKNLLEEKVIANQTDYKSILNSSWHITSSEFRDFIQESFGIDYSVGSQHASNNRNPLSQIIKKYKNEKTQKGKKSKIGLFEFEDIITSDEFIKYITKRTEIDFSPKNQKKMYQELMFLQMNKYQKSKYYKEKKLQTYDTIAYILTIFNNTLPDQIKELYSILINYNELNKNYHEDSNINDYDKMLLDIVNTRNKQAGIGIYKYDSIDDVKTTNGQQIIRQFLTDIDRWDNGITNGDLG